MLEERARAFHRGTDHHAIWEMLVRKDVDGFGAVSSWASGTARANRPDLSKG